MISKQVVLLLLVLSMVACLTGMGYAQFAACVGDSGISEPVNNQCPTGCYAQGMIPDQQDPGGNFDWIYNMTTATVYCTGPVYTGPGACSSASFTVSTLSENNVGCGVCPDVCNPNCDNYDYDSCNNSCSSQRGFTKSYTSLAANHSVKNNIRSAKYSSRMFAATARYGVDESTFSHSPLYRHNLVIIGSSAGAIVHKAG